MITFTIGLILTLIGICLMILGLVFIALLLCGNPIFTGVMGFIFGRKSVKKKKCKYCRR